MPRVPLPDVGVTSIRETCTASSEDITPRSSLLRTHAPIPCSSPLLRLLASFEKSSQVAISPCCYRDSPDVISANLSPDAWSPTRRSHRVHLPVSSSVSSAFPRHSLGRLPVGIRERDFSAGYFSRLQTFLYVQASDIARLPGRSYRCEYSRRAAEAFTSGLIVLRCLCTHRICYPSEYRQLTEKGLPPF